MWMGMMVSFILEYQPIGFCKLQFKHDAFFTYKDTSLYAIYYRL
ncbi:hypothetical protein EZS27_006488 [termite gut metagenome]|uniref:Uncharacterized protein n=1 Tax=termite gut metagenome TaxID=433724 RepID=A0A5J4SJD3_9ZZZZ